MASPAYLIVWDLDRTLGVFDGLEKLRAVNERAQVELRPGIAAALDRLSREGFSHTVLTLATPDYAELALRGTGLRHHFLEVACQGQRPKGDVEGIGETLGIPEAERPARMVFIGDHVLFDAPQDPRVVLHLEPNAVRRGADQAADLVLKLRELGDGSLRAGFDDLAGANAPFEELVRRELPGTGRLLLLPRAVACPVVAFEEEGLRPDPHGTAVSFLPADVYPELAGKLG